MPGYCPVLSRAPLCFWIQSSTPRVMKPSGVVSSSCSTSLPLALLLRATIVEWRNRSRTEPRSQITRAQNLVKVGHVVPEICLRTHKHTDRQTDRHGHHNTPLSYWDGVIIRPYRVHRMDAAYIGLLPGLPWVWRSPWVWGRYGDNLPSPQTHGDSMEIFQST